MIKTQAVVTHIEYSPSGDVTFVRFSPAEKFSFQEWQFIMIESVFNHLELGKPLKKPYSIATTNDELQKEWTLWVIVKRTMEGFMSDYLTKKIQIGDTIVITGPLGHMIDDHKHTKYLLVSTWSGLSPMVGLMWKLIENPEHIIVNIFGERYHKHVLASTEQLFSTQSERIKNMLFLSQDERDGYRRWHVQLALDEAISFLRDKDITVFICWSPIMVDDVRQMLTERWFSKEQMKFEKY